MMSFFWAFWLEYNEIDRQISRVALGPNRQGPMLKRCLSDLVVSGRVGLEVVSEGEARGLVSKMTLDFQA